MTVGRLAEVVWQNEFLLAVDKAPCVLTVPARQGASDPRPVLGLWLQEQLGQRLWPVHRLDYEVSGLVIFARTAEAHRIANRAFEARRVQKTYAALTTAAGAPSAGVEFLWASKLVRGKRRSFEAAHGQLARTRALCRGLTSPSGAFMSLAPLCAWTLKPETGKPHQLRVHLANAGHPIAGDRLYGGPAADPAAGIALRSIDIAFTDAEEAEALGLGAPLSVPSPW